MTGFAIAEYLIVVLEVFLICDVSARGLKPEMVERKESLIYLCASVGMNVFFRCLVKQVFRQLRFLYSKAAFWHCFCGQ